MQNKYLVLYLMAFSITVFAGCNKYLDEAPKGYTLLTTLTDYDQWLNDKALFLSSDPINQADNIDNPTIAVPPSSSTELMYTWAAQYTINLSSMPALWGDQYGRINAYNTVINGVTTATGGTPEQIKSLRAEALLGRALEYFYLVNEYAPSYDSATADKDLAVPFMTSNDVSDLVAPRSTVKEIYDHIITDIHEALQSLPKNNSTNRFRGSVAAAYSVLARVYFYGGNYSDGEKNAKLALQNTEAVMIDYNGDFPSSNLVAIRPDVIYGRQIGNAAFVCNLNLIHLFNRNDLRLQLLYYNTDNKTYLGRGKTLFYPGITIPSLSIICTGTTVQEMKLIIAAAAARNGDLPEALSQLNDIRKDRFDPEDYTPLQSDKKDTVIHWAIRERELELAYNGLRWFDMRRLDKEGRMDSVNRYDAQNNVIATLAPHSPKYTLQLPIQVLQYHADWQQSPWEN